jgi:hypothetical protein
MVVNKGMDEKKRVATHIAAAVCMSWSSMEYGYATEREEAAMNARYDGRNTVKSSS